MKNYGKYRTITEQINYNSRDYCIAYSQCEIIYYSQQSQENNSKRETVDNETKEHADSVRNNKPADLADMMGMADAYGIDIKIVDDPNYESTDEEKAKGTQIIVYTPGKVDEEGNVGIGHFQLKSQDGTLTDLSSEENDCGYAVIQKILSERGTDKSIGDLRNDRAQRIEDNPKQFLEVKRVLQWIETRHPQQANSLLIVGGKKKVERDPKEVLKDPNLPNIETLQKKLTKIKESIEEHNAKATTAEDKIEITEELKFILDDLNNEENTKVIATSKEARDVFYLSILKRIDSFIDRNQSVIINKCDNDLYLELGRVSNYWKSQIHNVDPRDVLYSQKSVNANFSSDGAGHLAESVGDDRANEIKGKRVDEEGKEFVRTHGASTLPVTVFLDEEHRLVAINNRGLLAHNLAGQVPLRILFVNPSGTERNRLNEEGLPTKNPPSFDRNN